MRVASHKEVTKIAKRKSLPKTQPLGDEGKGSRCKKWRFAPGIQPTLPLSSALDHSAIQADMILSDTFSTHDVLKTVVVVFACGSKM